jgi:hypothetical protein
MIVRLFMPQFAPLVESGEKRQTVRPTPVQMPRVGDTISLRTWTGKPYRSKQRVLRESVITRVGRIWINWNGLVLIDGSPASDSFAVDDGFSSWPEMLQWFQREHGLPFFGIVIYWK